MKKSQRSLEYLIMMVYVQLYMIRLHCTMTGMKYLKAEKCRLNYWKRLITKVRRKGLFPTWDDFSSYLLRLPYDRPHISEREYDEIILGVDEFQELDIHGDLNLSEALMEIAFNDYLQVSYKGFKYLKEDQKAYRVSSFWQKVAWIYLICKESYEYSHYQKLIERFEIPKVLHINQEVFDQTKRKTIQYFTKVG